MLKDITTHRIGLFLLLLFSLGMTSCLFQTKGSSRTQDTEEIVTVPTDAPWSEKMALSIMHRNPEAWMTDFRTTPRWSYTHGLIMMSMQRLWQQSSDEKYWEYAKSYADTMIDDHGAIKNYDITDFNIDHINSGKILFLLYERSGDVRYRKAIETLRTQLRWQPRTTDGGFWHKRRYPWQMWLDGLYMGSPFLAEYASRFDDPEAFDDVTHQLIIMEEHARDEETGLLFHGWDESGLQRWSDMETGLSPNIWGRAMGWYAMALVDDLDHLPETHPDRDRVIAIFERLAEAIIPYQSENGLWYQVVNMPEKEGNYEEATVSCMFAYALARGVNQGYLGKKHLETAKKAYQGILDHLITTESNGVISLEKCCAVAGLGGNPFRDGSYDYYVNEEVRANDAKGTGPFILASLEFEKTGLTFEKK